MSKDDGSSILDELDSRLDDFFAEDDIFSEDDSFEETSPTEESIASASVDEADSPGKGLPSVADDLNDVKPSAAKTLGNPLDSLKAVVLEMDWEINDENLTNYLNEIQRLIGIYQQDRPLYLFLKLHNSIGKYMLNKKASAHPDALKFLYAVFYSLEKATSADIPISEKNRLILEEVKNFKNLKAKLFPDKYQVVDTIISKKTTNASVNKVKQPVETGTQAVNPSKPDLSQLPADVQNEINKYIEGAIASKIEQLKQDVKKS